MSSVAEMSDDQQVAIIKSLPCFSMLTTEEAQDLAQLMVEKTYSPGDVIVTENDVIDSVYILLEGMAEVSHVTVQNKNEIKVPFAILTQGEAIGLNDTGFFSVSGIRTATVTALTDVVAYSLSIKTLHQFLHSHTHLQSAMYAAASRMLRMKLIKQSLPFHRLSHERLLALANQVEEVNVAAETVLFKQGEEGDCCYLIRSGRVEIVSTDDQGVQHQLAVLTAPTLFGEATLITRAPRNATARTLDKCELLVLKHAHLSELIESEDNVASMFMTLMVDRSKPLQNPHVTLHTRPTADGQSVSILKNPDNGKYFKLSDQGQFIWQQLNGEQTMQEITLSLAERYNFFAPDVVAALISKLAKAGFIKNIEIEREVNLQGQPLWVRAMVRARRVLEARIAIGDADKWITKSYNKIVHILFTPIGQVIIAVLALAGFVAFCSATGNIINVFKTFPNTWLLLLFLVPFAVYATAMHELGHAYATKAFGYEVHYMGVGWYWFGPVAFTDTSDMWLSTRGPRIIVNLAGIYTDILHAGIAALLSFIIPNVFIQVFLWLFAMYAYLNAFRMLSPLQELDGYYVLMDVLERPNLRQSAIIWLLKGFPKALRKPSLFKKNFPEVCYWLACVGYLVLISMVTLFLQTFVFKILGIHSSNPFVSLALPFFVVIVSSLSIIADLRSQS